MAHEGEGRRSSANRSDSTAAPDGRSRSYRISREQFIRETSPRDRELLRNELNRVLIEVLRAERAAYLDGLGIIYPVKRNLSVTHSLSSTESVVRREILLSAEFEKCYDLVSLQREQFPAIVETKDLASRIYPKLPLVWQVKWTERDVGRYLRGLIRSIRDEVVIDGVSRQLDSIGQLFSLHNRQGDNPDDWFAGSDIFLESVLHEPVFVGAGKVYARPVLKNSWELLEAACGAPCHRFEISLVEQLSSLGYDGEAFQDQVGPEGTTVPVAVFRIPGGGDRGEEILIYCTDGLRNSAHCSPDEPGTELVFQLPIPNRSTDEQWPKARWLEDTTIPEWPARPMTMGWILLQTSRKKSLNFGAGLSCDTPIIPFCDTNLRTVFTTPFSLIRSAQRGETGAFRYVNLVGITDDEARVAELYGSEHLRLLLNFRGYDQVTRPERSSITTRTGLLPGAPTRPAHPSQPVEQAVL